MGPATAFDLSLQSQAVIAIQKLELSMEQLQMNQALDELWNLIRRTNKYIDETKPWVLAKDPTEKAVLGTVIYHLCEALRLVAVALKPFLVETPLKIGEQLGIEKEIARAQWSDTRWGLLPPGTEVKSSVKPIFPRIDLEEYYRSSG